MDGTSSTSTALCQADRAAIEMARVTKGKPTIIIGKTIIGKGAPNMAGSEETHGAPLPEAELKAAKVALGFNPEESFVVPEDVRALVDQKLVAKAACAAEGDSKVAAFKAGRDADKVALMDALLTKAVPANILEELLKAVPEKTIATRVSGGEIMNAAARFWFLHDRRFRRLEPLDEDVPKGLGDFTADNRAGRNIHFGVRELGMGLIANGLALAGYAIPFSSTFMVFSVYEAALRMAIQQLHEVLVFTHDSIFVGEDGPTTSPSSDWRCSVRFLA